ncbi:LysM peptidoglycan-binding domain-containing protein [Dyella subtropica]|uniref:LysM peptidoglycan-binding domain-containing protein n=1 Tax=Dyella subtropica TaxID=2992127 RepID=UPI0022578BAE|nr:LysM peptidoglycan-binding domain-containing protein [Dyella subtropica]
MLKVQGYPVGGSGRKRATTIILFAAMLGLAGCAQMKALKSKMAGQSTSSPSAPTTDTVVEPASVEAPRESSLAAIVNGDLQQGHYATGEKALRQYLRQHPNDRSAQAMLRQLTGDPVQILGSPARTHVVQAGDSYSTLAARYLGDANLFLVLARYNGSTNPSVLRVGQTLRLPASVKGAASQEATAGGGSSDAPSGTEVAAPLAAAPVAEAPSVKAVRLQKESVTLLAQGQKTQALARLDEALNLDPKLKPVGTEATSLRTQLLASYHERAIVLYRDQQLDPAIALWDRVLAIDPSYEPAMIYRTRALELKQRLKQF